MSFLPLCLFDKDSIKMKVTINRSRSNTVVVVLLFFEGHVTPK